VPEALEAVILQCLEKDVSARLPNVAELSKALFPFAAHATRASLERTSRVLRRAGVTVKSVPPPSLDGEGGAETLPALPSSGGAGGPDERAGGEPARSRTNVSPGAQTRTAWDTAGQQAARPRSGARTAVIAGFALVLLGGGGVLAFQRWGGTLLGRGDRSTASVTMTATAAPTSVGAMGATATATSVAIAPPQAPPAVSSTAAPVTLAASAASASPPASAAATPPTVTGGPRGKLAGRGSKPEPKTAQPPSVAAQPPVPPPAPVAPPPKPAGKPGDDTDGFGDRK
jgi:hypothetical protein